MTPQADVAQLLDAAEELFYERGYQSVGMDALRTASGMPLKRIYSLFKGKDAIAVAMLDRRDERWHASLAERVDRQTEPGSRVLTIFDWLADWLSDEGHRGCAWINAFGELGGVSPDVADAVRQHKTRLKAYMDDVVHDAGASQAVADAIFLLGEGCMVTAGISGNTDATAQAKEAASRLLGSD
ncbi:TetR/AcrR family transcriptional regulator [Microbacterium sp. A588]